MEELRLGVRLIWGDGALSAAGELAGRRVLVVSDSFLSASGALRPVLDALGGSETRVFDRVTGEPTLPMVAEGIVELQRLDAQAVVAFGGGSAMDCAKGVIYCSGRHMPLWCIPTTAGTGSEVTSFSVLTDPESGVKYPLVDDALLPDAAILDGQFLAGVPAAVTVNAGMDVITHAAEALVAVRGNIFTDALAEKSFVTALNRLPAAWEGDGEAKTEMLFASALAGIAFNAAGLGVCHALSHSLGARLHAPHGKVNALLLPQVIEANAQSPGAARKYAQLAKLCGLSPTPRSLAGALRRLCRRLGLPQRLEGEAELAQVAVDALRDPCMADNPITFTPQQLEHILREVVG